MTAYPLANGFWQLAWNAPDGTRTWKAFAHQSEARQFATKKATELANQKSHVRSLTPAENLDYEAAKAILPTGVKLGSAVEFYVARHPAHASKSPAAEFASEDSQARTA